MRYVRPMTVPLMGRSYSLTSGRYSASITEVGATLRSLTLDGHDVILPFDADAFPVSCQGQELLPWPNRIRDGHYVFEGVDQQVPITEIDRNTALHGLTLWLAWTVVSLDEDRLVQRVVLHGQPGWPGVLECEITHSLDSQGLTVGVRARNVGAGPVPFGYGAHPYLLVPGASGPIDAWTLAAPVDRYVSVDERLLPTGVEDVSGTANDLRTGVPLGDREFDTAFRFTEAPTKRWEARLSCGSHSTTMWIDPPLSWLQVFTPPARHAVAVEPMTCGPDAFNEGPTHDSMMVLAPGDEISLTWGLTAD